MNIQTLKSAWCRVKKPSRATLKTLEAAGAKIDYWPDYAPSKASKQATVASAVRSGSPSPLLSKIKEAA